MMHKPLLTLAALCVAALTLAAREIHLKGGVLTPLDDTQVESFADDMNFAFAYRFSDGTIHLGHSKGIHTVTEHGCNDISPDNGRTWRNDVEGGLGCNTFEGLDGGKYQINCWDLKRAKVHTVELSRYDDATGKCVPVARCEVELPYVSQFLTHRDVIRLKSGRLLATAYGNIEGQRKSHAFAIESADDGRTWTYLSTIADDPEGKTAEGPDEATVFQLRDGRVCAFYRDGDLGYLHQCFSSDEGRTWTAPEAVTLFTGCASPNGRVLADGTIVVISGRPKLYLLIDLTGTGRHYQKVSLYRGSGSSYATVLETAPNEILCIYDESNFGSWRSLTPFSRIHASRFRLSRSGGEAAQDPLAARYDTLFRPTTLDVVLDGSAGVAAFDYKARAQFPEGQAVVDVVEIPERPHPVLRLVSHGEKPEERFALFRSMDSVLEARKVRVGVEFRLGDMGEERPQFAIGAVVGATDEDKGFLAYVQVAADRIEMAQADGDPKVLPYDIGTTGFHAFVLEGDMATGVASLYVEGQEDKPILTATMPKALGEPAIFIGDGSNGIYGSADVSHFGWRVE